MTSPGAMDDFPRLDGRRRAIVFAATAVGYVALPAALFGDRLGLQTAPRVAGAAVSAICFVAIMAVLAPQRGAYVERAVGAPAHPLRGIVLMMLAFAVILIPVSRFVLATTWPEAIGRGVGLLVYCAVFQTLARIQRRGISPWLRPAGYGFALAGSAGGLAWAGVAGSSVLEGVARGLSWAFVHYVYVRIAMRAAEKAVARNAGAESASGSAAA